MPTGGGRGGGGGGGRRNQLNQGLRQSVNANFNYGDTASDNVNLFPQLGGKTAGHNYSLQTGYSLGYHRINSNLTAGWNRSLSQVKNFFTDGENIASDIGVFGPGGTTDPLNSSPLNYGIPNVVLSGTTGLNEQQPSFRIQQTISLSETLSYGHGKHNFRFGGDYRRVHSDILGSSNATGTFDFTGTTDEAFAKLLAGTPDASSIQSSASKDYLRQNVWDLYAQDDFRAYSNLTLSYGVRYEYFSPYIEKFNHLAELATNPGFTDIAEIYPGCTGTYCGTVPRSLVYPFHGGIAPRIGIALRLPKSTVLRAGYAINFNNGQYSTFVTSMVHQPPYSNVQQNTATTPIDGQTISLKNGFPLPVTSQVPTYSLDPHYTLPYVQVWNIDVQKTLPLGIVLNVGSQRNEGNASRRHQRAHTVQHQCHSHLRALPDLQWKPGLGSQPVQVRAIQRLLELPQRLHSGAAERACRKGAFCLGAYYQASALHRRCRLHRRHLYRSRAELAESRSGGR